MLDKKLEGFSSLGPLWPRQLGVGGGGGEGWCPDSRKEKRGFRGQAKHTSPKVQPGQAWGGARGIGSSSEKGAGGG